MSHTPGPWTFRELTCQDHRGMGWVEDANGKDIACCGAMDLWEAGNRANARLIVAAPDLLEELKNIANANTRTWDDPDDFKAWAQNRARFAIAKAEGKP